MIIRSTKRPPSRPRPARAPELAIETPHGRTVVPPDDAFWERNLALAEEWDGYLSPLKAAIAEKSPFGGDALDLVSVSVRAGFAYGRAASGTGSRGDWAGFAAIALTAARKLASLLGWTRAAPAMQVGEMILTVYAQTVEAQAEVSFPGAEAAALADRDPDDLAARTVRAWRADRNGETAA